MQISRTASLRHPALWIALLCAVEVLALASVYQFAVPLECHETGFNLACRGLRSLAARALAMMAAGLLLVWAWPGPVARFLAAGDAARTGLRWPLLHGLGVLLLLAPAVATLLPGAALDIRAAFAPVAVVLAAGALAAALGALFWLAPAAEWWRLLSHDRYAPLAILAAAALVPDLANLVLPLWESPILVRMTFDAVQAYLALSSGAVVSDPAGYVIGLEGFTVHIARQCSGVEGVALVSTFVLFYGALFRRDLHLWRYALTVLPAAIAASWTLNIVRIGVLIQLGASVSPELAVNGFHSYAGWLFFTLLALGVIGVVHALPWLHRTARAGATVPLSRDVSAALTLPLAVMLILTVLQHAFFPHPEIGYPLKAIAMALALAVFWRVWRSFDWKVDGVALAAGCAVGFGWLLFDRSGEGDAGLSLLLSQMTAASLYSWIAFRILGTVLLVPLIEEAFFRGFLLGRLDMRAGTPSLIAILGSSLLFGLLHGRWVAGTVAGLVFALVYLRRRSLPDAVQSHVAANLVVAIGAAATGDWQRI
ncbi:exosortase E/protease, VPEID-CTERM system [Aliigemmobacter aestuarii]|uniref:Exosortase E/protease, VPEID-CTERM system n=1 Tax=Aliigemmobacter aestuarii TaxID=1445661 RepID=A0A4S3MRS1_9RHOB|nr:exosortase E/protease, VPEID-CTERM system [Gemmobacter aestuarii]THD85246.1 exosortase E/protease, VPEID-CTERM system [Gemmobacter aestuarii]